MSQTHRDGWEGPVRTKRFLSQRLSSLKDELNPKQGGPELDVLNLLGARQDPHAERILGLQGIEFALINSRMQFAFLEIS